MTNWHTRMSWRTEAAKDEFLAMNRFEAVKCTPNGRAFMYQASVNGYVCTLTVAANESLAGNLLIDKVDER